MSCVCAGQGDASARREIAERRSPSRHRTWSRLVVCGPAQSVLTRAILLAERCATNVVLGRVERSPSPRRRDKKSQESRGHGHRPRSFVEVLKAEGSKICSGHGSGFYNSPGFLRRDGHFSPTGRDQAGSSPNSRMLETRRRRFEDVFKNTSRRRSVSNWPRMHGTRLHANIVKLERDCFWTRKRRLGGETMLALELAQQEADTWAARLHREQEQVSAVTMPMHEMCPGTPQLWAAGLAAALPPEIAKHFQSWLDSISSDAMGHQSLENADDGLECEVDVLDAQSNSASSVLSPSASSRAAPAFAPFRAAAQRTRRAPFLPPLLRGAVKPWSGEEDSHETPVPQEASQTPPAT